MKSRRVRKQKTRRSRNTRNSRRLRGGANVVYTCYFYEPDGTMEPLDRFNPFEIVLDEDSNQTLVDIGMNPGDSADSIDEDGTAIPLNLGRPILSQSHLIKNNRINIHKAR